MLPHHPPSTLSSNNLLSLPKFLCSPVCLPFPPSLSLSDFVSLSVVVHLTLLVCLYFCLSICLSIVQFGSLLCRRTMQTLIKLCKLNWIELNWAYFVQFINFLAKMSKCVWRAVCLCVEWAWHAPGLLLLLVSACKSYYNKSSKNTLNYDVINF